MDFYRDAFGGELTMQTFAEGGMSAHPSNDDRIMHAQLTTAHGLVLTASDVPDGMLHEPGSAISISLSGADDPALRSHFEALAANGRVIVGVQQVGLDGGLTDEQLPCHLLVGRARRDQLEDLQRELIAALSAGAITSATSTTAGQTTTSRRCATGLHPSR
jgi:uncharacterized glyoxalase superfamily protein PhnB